MLKAVDFFSTFQKLEKRQLNPNSNVDSQIYLKIYPDYRWTFMTGRGYTPDSKAGRGPAIKRPLYHPLMTKEGAAE